MKNATQPGLRYWSLVEPIWLPLNASWDEGPEEFVRQFQATPTKSGHLYAAHWCQAEVCNGGLQQFFCNTTGLLAPEALSGFEAIGLREWSEVLFAAISFFGHPYPRERTVRLAVLPKANGRERQVHDPFSALDNRFFEWLHAMDDRWELAADRYADGA